MQIVLFRKLVVIQGNDTFIFKSTISGNQSPIPYLSLPHPHLSGLLILSSLKFVGRVEVGHKRSCREASESKTWKNDSEHKFQ